MHRLLIPSLLALSLSACLSAKDVSPRESEPQDGKAASSRNEEPAAAYRPMDFEEQDREIASDFALDLSLARQSGYDDAAKASPSTPPTDPNESQSSKEPEAPQQRLVIYTALLRLAVDNLQDVFRRAELITTELGGYVQSSTMQQRVLRIPSKHYQEALSQLQELGTILALEQSSEDVTEAFSDVVRRIENLRALQARYTQLLAAANSIQVRLAIEKELRRISQELRELEERRRSLADRIAYATITLELEAKPKHRVAHSGRVQPFPFVDDYGLSSVLR